MKKFVIKESDCEQILQELKEYILWRLLVFYNQSQNIFIEKSLDIFFYLEFSSYLEYKQP